MAFCQLDRLYLVAGEGQYLKIFDHDRRPLLCTKRVFDFEAIHGITCQKTSQADKCEALLLIWGGRSVCIFGIRRGSKIGSKRPIEVVKHVPELRLNDWILDGCFQDPEVRTITTEETRLDALLAVAHNDLHQLRLNIEGPEDSSTNYSLCCIASGPRSILYSVHVVWPSRDRALIAAGTVFGEVLLWSCDIRSSDSTASISLHHTFIGHEGSVFGVRISEEGEQGNRVLASCSDDRTIRVWNIEETKPSASDVKVIEEHSRDREVGFIDGANSETNSACCMAMIMGHASRIWGIRFLSHYTDSWELMSHGEDGTAQLWRLGPKLESKVSTSLAASQAFELSHQKTYPYGKNLWAMATYLTASGEYVAASGGSDGRIVTYKPVLSNDSRSKDIRSFESSIEQASTPVEQLADKNAMSPEDQGLTRTKKIFDSLQGRWRLSRNIDSTSATYPSGKLEGVALFQRRPPSDEVYAAEYLYSENGDFVTQNGLTMKVNRQYSYRYNQKTDTITAWFVKPDDESIVDYLFHSLNFRNSDGKDVGIGKSDSQRELTASGDHLCIEDQYNAFYSFRLHNTNAMQWSVSYVVLGPKKDYTTKATYTRDQSVTDPDSTTFADQNSAVATVKNGSRNTNKNCIRKSSPDAFKTYSWISETEFLTTTQAGNLMIGTLLSKRDSEHQPEISWELIGHQSLLKSSCITTSLPSEGMAFLIGMDGTILLYEHYVREINSVYKLPGKAAFLTAQTVSAIWTESLATKSGLNAIGGIAACLGSSEATAFISHPGSRDYLTLLQDKCLLTLPPKFIITSSCFLNKEKAIILGSRSGSLAIYALSSNPFSLYPPIAPSLFDNIHGQDAVTVIEAIPQTPQPSHKTYILTAGRDGTYSIHLITFSPQTITLQTLHTAHPPFGPNIEGAHITPHSLTLWGFLSKSFIVHNATQNTSTMTVDCGGSHRNWAYTHRDDASGGGSFVYTKASVCHVHAQKKASHQVFQQGGHGREIKTMALSPLIPINTRSGGEKSRFLATGAEDTAIRLFHLNPSTSSPKCTSILTSHTTGLQKLLWSPDGRYLFSAAGVEEFFVWRIRPAPLVTIGVVCEAKCPVVTEEGDLRVMDFSVLSIDEGTSEGDENGRDYLLSIIYSDSSLRTFRYQTHTQTFIRLYQATYTSHCLTQTTYLHLNHKLYLCTASTDGHLAFWPLPLSSKSPISPPNQDNKDHRSLLFSDRLSLPSPTPLPLTHSNLILIHQNSIKSLLAIPLSPHHTLLITSGDDGAIAFTTLNAQSLETSPILLISKAHASAATAVANLGVVANNDGDGEVVRHRIVSVGNDQRLKTWLLGTDITQPGVEGLSIHPESNAYTAIADASSLETAPAAAADDERGRLWVAGVGIECWGVGRGRGEETLRRI